MRIRQLDAEMRPFRAGGRVKEPTRALLRTVRQALRMPAREVGAELGVGASAVSRLERAEAHGTITMRALGRMAEAMGCQVVYGIVPKNGRTLEWLAEERLWKQVLGK
ncbi:MAG TPA: helix-turn-helix domain-containing protein [Bryobacteraceae bacterium]|nr:helix-turn-helix domain-containing protein [Bryobacteraceae bacterium]